MYVHKILNILLFCLPLQLYQLIFNGGVGTRAFAVDTVNDTIAENSKTFQVNPQQSI